MYAYDFLTLRLSPFVRFYIKKVKSFSTRLWPYQNLNLSRLRMLPTTLRRETNNAQSTCTAQTPSINYVRGFHGKNFLFKEVADLNLMSVKFAEDI